MRFPTDARRRLGAVALLLFPPFLLFLLATVIPPTEDTHWRKIEINDGSNERYVSQGLFELVDFKGGEEVGSHDNLGEDGWCSDDKKREIGDKCCEPFRTTQGLAIAATAVSFVAFALLVGSSVRARGRISRMHTNAAGVLSFAAGVLGISLVIIYDMNFDEMACGEEKIVGGVDLIKQMYKELEYGPLFFLATTGSILSVLAGTALFFVHDDEAYTKRYASIKSKRTVFDAPVGARVPAKSTTSTESNTFPGTLVF